MRSSVLQSLSQHGAHFSTLASQMRRLVACRAGCFLSFTHDVAGVRSVVFMRSRDDGRTFQPFDQRPAGPNDYRPAALATDGGVLAVPAARLPFPLFRRNQVPPR